MVSIKDREARSDREALTLAKSLVDGHAVALWDGLRFIEHFDAILPAS